VVTHRPKGQEGRKEGLGQRIFSQLFPTRLESSGGGDWGESVGDLFFFLFSFHLGKNAVVRREEGPGRKLNEGRSLSKGRGAHDQVEKKREKRVINPEKGSEERLRHVAWNETPQRAGLHPGEIS